MRVRSVAPPPPAAGGTDVVAAAAGIGERLAREAVWHRGRCNWIGVEWSASHASSRRRPPHRALGASLGDGTAGIALFLAHLHAATGAAAHRRTALGAMTQALANAPAGAGGLYDGRPGIAYAAARCGRLLGDEGLVARAVRLARAQRPTPAEVHDVISGTAGEIVALLALARLLGGDERLVARAARVGGELAAAARREPAGWSWPAAGTRFAEHGLCGMAQGAAGAAWALVEVFEATRDGRYRAAAERALAYERGWFDAGAGNWPDLRGIARRERRGTFNPPYATAWCHGAPGIALSRLRGWQVLGDESLRREAVAALETTAAHAERELIETRADFTLCHGLAGAADVLLRGAALLPGAAELARRIGDIGVGRYATSLDGWPCGDGRNPGLLTGDAGIGLFLLRLHDPAPASMLLAGAPAS